MGKASDEENKKGNMRDDVEVEVKIGMVKR